MNQAPHLSPASCVEHDSEPVAQQVSSFTRVSGRVIPVVKDPVVRNIFPCTTRPLPALSGFILVKTKVVRLTVETTYI